MKPAAVAVLALVSCIAGATLAAGADRRDRQGQPAVDAAPGSPVAACLAAAEADTGSPIVRADLAMTRDERGWYAVEGQVLAQDADPGRVHCTVAPDPSAGSGIRLAELELVSTPVP